MAMPTAQTLFDSACHIGHPTRRWNPKIKPYLYGTQKGVHIIDLVQTEQHLKDLCEHMKKLQKEGKSILFVSTKQQSTALIEHMGEELSQPVVTKKWIPGLLTNWQTIKQRLKHYLELQQSFSSGEIEKYTKKEQVAQRKKLAKLDTALGGVANMKEPPHAVFVVDAVRDHVAVAEARKLKLPVYGICDTNANPDDFTAFVPANDDAVKSLSIILETVLAEMGGKVAGEKKPKADESDSSDE